MFAFWQKRGKMQMLSTACSFVRCPERYSSNVDLGCLISKNNRASGPRREVEGEGGGEFGVALEGVIFLFAFLFAF